MKCHVFSIRSHPGGSEAAVFGASFEEGRHPSFYMEIDSFPTSSEDVKKILRDVIDEKPSDFRVLRASGYEWLISRKPAWEQSLSFGD